MQNTWAGPYGPPTFPYQLQPRAYDVFAGKKKLSLFCSVHWVFDFFLCLGHFNAERQVMGN